MAVTIKRENWKRVTLPNNDRLIALRCPECKRIILQELDADKNGVIKNVVCGNDECGFHRNVQLEGWKELVTVS